MWSINDKNHKLQNVYSPKINSDRVEHTVEPERLETNEIYIVLAGVVDLKTEGDIRQAHEGLVADMGAVRMFQI
jgi:hypothetical protein